MSTVLDFADMNTHLPVIRIDTGEKIIPGESIEEVKGKYEVTEDGESEIKAFVQLYEGQSLPQEMSAMIHYRGNSSRSFRKKSYDLNFVDKNQHKKKVSMLGMEADNNWALHGPYLDRSLLRNYLAMNLTGEIMNYAPNVRYVEVFVNDKYEGLYLLMEKILKSEGRLALTSPENNSDMTSYIVEYDRPYRMDSTLTNFLTYTYKSFPSAAELKYPKNDEYTIEREQFVSRDLSYITNVIYQYPYAQDNQHYKDLIDVQAFYDYFIINELFRNIDAGHYSTYFYRDLKGKLTPVVWDFNNSLDNYQELSFSESGYSMTQSIFYERLLKDEDFTNGLIRRYVELRKNKLNEDRINNYIDDTVNFLGSSIERNNTRWQDMYDLSQYDTRNYLHRVERNVENHEEAIAQLKGYLEKRGEWLDNNIDTLRQYSHPSRHSHESIK
ncbi:CotH kinase family protein [Planococcus sp. S3-L1]|uniref:CotH kinase family protein n=1 Tax=Planococcus sp. S3-L1 TaxID=3046200 RepID=UPI0024BB4B3D|nr:CotH kinase family protein [Planococcus sp. S3-L1]MDJ0332944.1 CotH kinase family protein [Planococcus sp. S3-L1]